VVTVLAAIIYGSVTGTSIGRLFVAGIGPAVILCILVLELSLDSYIVPFLLLINIGIAILFKLEL